MKIVQLFPPYLRIIYSKVWFIFYLIIFHSLSFSLEMLFYKGQQDCQLKTKQKSCYRSKTIATFSLSIPVWGKSSVQGFGNPTSKVNIQCWIYTRGTNGIVLRTFFFFVIKFVMDGILRRAQDGTYGKSGPVNMTKVRSARLPCRQVLIR